ncbi:exopolyphosphatase [Moniliophthora roreri MCA 2997]|uniref:Exopolyphosphatase n=1 Tax=Moniliophthora roreri (strain MCA 2997) TaxID=1381753 RepID=V2WNZ8_MONRO|nr:exopolyphosphatase [Moniliophthora roreri MCA 2997]
MSRRILADFLVASKQHYLSALKASKNDWTVVMGNESGDLDTIACAIAYAYHQTHHMNKPTIPFIRIHPDDLKLRAENIYALSLAGVTEPQNQLFLLSDVPEGKWNQTNFALVDHNRLAPEYAQGDGEEKPRVVAVIDHHEDEGLYTETANPRTIVPTGSCASQVAAFIFSGTLHDSNSTPPSIPPEVATLLLSAILVDTSLKATSEGGKATDIDVHAAALLMPHVAYPEEVTSEDIQSMASGLAASDVYTTSWASLRSLPQPESNGTSLAQLLRKSPPLKTLMSTLSAKKSDVSHLSAPELLKRDYKEYTFDVELGGDKITLKAGLSTVPVELSAWVGAGLHSNDGDITTILTDGREFMEKRGLAILGILTHYQKERKKGGKPKSKREMAWLIRGDYFSSSGPSSETSITSARILACHIFAGIEASEVLSVKKHKKFKRYTLPPSSTDSQLSNGDDAHASPSNIMVRIYKQGNAHATRKATAPILRRILKGE